MLHPVFLVLVTCSARALVSRADEGAGLRQQRLLADGEPQSATLLLGSSYNLSCKWDGEPSGKLWWMRNGALFAQHNRSFAVPRHRVYIERGANGTVYTLALQSVALSDEGTYRCQASKSDSSLPAVSREAIIVVISRPEAVVVSVLNASDDASEALDAGDRRPQAPTALNCVAGRECLLQCVARRARPAATLHWFISGMSVSVLSHVPADSLVNPAAAQSGQSGPAGDVSGLWHLIAPALSTQETNPSNRTQPNGAYSFDTISILRLRPRRGDSGHRVSCLASSAASERFQSERLDKDYGDLNVRYMPQPEIQLRPEAPLYEGDRVLATCRADANPRAVQYRWTLGPGLGERTATATASDGGTLSQFVLERVNHTHHGARLECDAMNAVASNSTALELNVRYSPRLQASEWAVEAEVGRSANLSCVAQSNPPATITWVRVAEPDSPGSRPSAAASRLVPLDSGERGQWVLVPVAGEAEYRCTAATDDPRLRLATGTVHVLIRGLPQIRKSPFVFVAAGRSAQLTCSADSIPKPDPITGFTWSLRGRVITNSARFRVHSEDMLRGRSSVLTIDPVEPEDFGHYNCSVANALGFHSATIVLERRDELNLAVLAGASATAVLVVLALVIVVLLLCLRNARREKREAHEPRLDPSIKENGHLLAPEQNGGAAQRSTSASLLQLSQQQLSQRQYSLSSLHRSAATSTSVSACPQSMAAVGATFGSPIHQLVQLSPSHGACRYALASTNPNASPLCGIPTDTVDVDVGVGMASMALAGEDMRAVPVSYCSLHDPTAAGSYVGYDLSGAGGGADLTLAPLAYQMPPQQYAGGACSCCLIDPQANGGYYPQATVLTNGGGIMCQPIPEEAHGDDSSKSCDSGIAAGSNGSNPLLPSPASAAAQCSTGGQSYALCVQSAGGFSTPRFVPQSFYSGHSPLHLPNNNGTLPRRTPLPTSTIVSAPYDTFQRLTPVHLHSHYPQNQLQLQPPPQHSADLRTPITCPASSSASGLGGLLTGGGVVYENYHQGVGMGAGAGGADLYRPVTPSSRRTHQVSSPLDASLIASEDSDAATVLHLATFV